MTDNAFETIRYATSASLALVTLDRPGKLNAINGAMIAELHRAMDQAEADAGVSVIVIDGAGKAFSAGFDLDDEAPDTAPTQDTVRTELVRDFDLIMRFWDCPKPTIASVHGFCIGGALELMLACDLAVSSTACRFGAPEVRFGSCIVAMLLPWVCGPRVAREILLTGDNRFDAERALALGLVNRLADPAQLQEATQALAAQIANSDPFAVQMTKRAINRSLDAGGLREALRESLEIAVQIESTDTSQSRQFTELVRSKGTRAAVEWLEARFEHKPAKG